MESKKTISLPVKILVAVLLVTLLVGGGVVYSITKTVSWGIRKYQNLKIEKHDNFFGDIQNFFEKKEAQNVQPVKVIDEQSQVIEVVKKASPAVVSIVASAEVPVFENYYDNPSNLPDELQQFFSIPRRRQSGTQEKRIGAGTGFLVSADGYVITNKHVVSEADVEYTVYLNTEESRGEKIKARVVARDPKNDLAVLKIDKDNLPFIEFSDSSKLQVGQTVITIGYALGEFDNTVSKGVVSGLSRSIIAGGGFFAPAERLKNLIQSDAAINPGNSGGPMLDIEGNVIGVNVAMASAENIGFAILGNEAKNVFEQVRETGKIKEKEVAFLGVRHMIISETSKAKNNLPYNYGALVTRGELRDDLAVLPGSPADKAGIVENDIILEINGEKVTEKNQLIDLIAKYNPNDEVIFKIYHRGEEKEVKIKLDKN